MSAELVATMLRAGGTVLFFAGLGCGLLGAFGRLANGREWQWGLWTVANCLYLAGDILRADWPWVAADTAVLAPCAYWWLQERRKRKDRRKAIAALGAKSKALRDALVRKARESARPSPVLRPSLGGAR